MRTPAPCWRLVPGQHLLHRCWDGECVLYNDLTGATHLLGDGALALLELLRAAPLPAAALEDAMAPEDGAAPADGALDALLADLAALHLIEAAPC